MNNNKTDTAKRLAYLFQRYFAQTISAKEKDELFLLIDVSADDEHLTTLLKQAWEQLSDKDAVFENTKSDDILNRILSAKDQDDQVIPLFPSRKRSIWKISAAAAVIVAVAATGLYFHRHENKISTPKLTLKPVLQHDALPGGNKALLTLANGKTIVLDSARNGILARQGSVNINKAGSGLIVYNTNSTNDTSTAINTISTPRGGQYQVVLPDGSRVWLNSASSLRFPTAFTGNQREVELTGEGYFEVAKNKSKPFNVKVKDINVAVLGTHFNIMAYNDEAAVKTTLLEGLVRLTYGNVTDMLKPGQQGVINNKGIKIIDVDTDEAVAWKNGFFDFERANIQDIMKQLSRWYGTEVIYEGKVPDDEFVGKISRDVKLSQVLHILELSHVRFRIENKKIIVTP